jgi:hypothetical protein
MTDGHPPAPGLRAVGPPDPGQRRPRRTRLERMCTTLGWSSGRCVGSAKPDEQGPANGGSHDLLRRCSELPG